MKKLILLILLLSSLLHSQMLSAPTYPTGTLFTESFSRGSSPCGHGAPWKTGLYAYSGCNVMWDKLASGTGGSIAIGASPGSKVYPYGPLSLNIATGTSGATYIGTEGYVPNVTSTVTVTFSLNVTSSAEAAYGSQHILCLSSSSAVCTSTNTVCLVQFNPTSTGVPLLQAIGNGSGSSSSSRTAALTLGADNKVTLVCNPAGGTSSISLNGATPLTFTTATAATFWNTIFLGADYGSTANSIYSIGYLKIDGAMQGAGYGPSVYMPFDTASTSSGTNISTSNASLGVVGGNGSWSSCPNNAYQQWVTAGQLNLANPVTAYGVQYGNGTPSNDLGSLYANPSSYVVQYCNYSFVSFSPVVSRCEHINMNIATNDTATAASFDPLEAASSTDYVSINRALAANNRFGSTGKIWMESPGSASSMPLNDIGTGFAYTAGTTFIACSQEQAYNATWTAGADFLIEGVVGNSSGGVTSPPAKCSVGETMTQNTSGATATLITAPTEITDTLPAQAMEVVVAGGTANSSNYWLGGTSGCYFWPSSIVTGTTATTPLSVGETIIQATSTAQAIVLQGATSFGAGESTRVLVTSGTPDGTHTWTGQTTGGTIIAPSTPATVTPRTFNTLTIYDSGCNFQGTQKRMASGTLNSLPAASYLGRVGDQGTTAFNWYTDNVILNYTTGAMPTCQ
jgi:hypothetical protein